jgi:hypothetical protein
MECNVRVISGPSAGETMKLLPGANLIGRSAKAALRLSATDISYEHCVITRSGDEYVLENLSALGTYVDDAKLTGPVKLRPRDQIRLSRETVLRLEAADGGGGLLAGRRGILGGLVAVLLVVVGFVAYDLLSPQQQADDWNRAYALLEPWVAVEVQAKRLPEGMATLFRDAWRMEQSQDYARSSAAWLRLQLSLDVAEAKAGLQNRSREHPAALQRILTPPAGNMEAPEPLDDEKAAAFAQFVKRRLDWSSRQGSNR